MIQLEIKVTGRVQGVGYRYFVQQKARELNIKGWVKNLPSGAVLIRAQGEKIDLETFKDFLRIGPTRARVEKLITAEIQDLSDFKSFNAKF